MGVVEQTIFMDHDEVQQDEAWNIRPSTHVAGMEKSFKFSQHRMKTIGSF